MKLIIKDGCDYCFSHSKCFVFLFESAMNEFGFYYLFEQGIDFKVKECFSF